MRQWFDCGAPQVTSGVAALLQRVGDQELELARLVAAGSQPELIVALDPDLGPAERLGEVRQELDRRRVFGVAAAGKAGEVHLGG